MTVPVILLDEDGRPYNGKASIKLRLRNRGIQDLFNGKVELDKSAEAEDINIKKVSDGELTNLIPQETIKAGEVIGEVSIEGEKQEIVANQDVEVSAGNAIVMRFARNRVIFDGFCSGSEQARGGNFGRLYERHQNLGRNNSSAADCHTDSEER